MIRQVFKFLMFGTLLFAVVHTTYQVNVQSEQIKSINASLARFQAERMAGYRKEAVQRQALKKELTGDANLLNTMKESYAQPPHASDEFLKGLH